jgi:predicted RNA-binding Zn ribbon-like protein
MSWESGKSLQPGMQQELNQLLLRYPMLARLTKSEYGPITELWFEPQKPDDLFAPLAQSAAALFSSVDRNRVRMCGNCVLHFYDTSKKGTRHWCSMRLCGNRVKVAAYAERRRKRK